MRGEMGNMSKVEVNTNPWMQILSLMVALYVACTVYQNHQTQLKELKTGHTKMLEDLEAMKKKLVVP